MLTSTFTHSRACISIVQKGVLFSRKPTTALLTTQFGARHFQPRIRKSSCRPLSVRHQQSTKDLYLPIKPWQTRVAKLEPGVFNEPLRCELRPATIIQFEGLVLDETNENISYDALSYTWGDIQPTETLHCNGHSFHITPNLASALRRLRDPTKHRFLWVDAICIDQSNAVEKSVQIRHMMTIFQKAREVIAWIGEPRENTSLAFEMLKNAYLVQSTAQQIIPVALQNISVDRLLSEVPEEAMKDLYAELMDLYSRPWLMRTWVRQEIFSARKLTLLCGNFSIDWDAFRSTSLFFKLASHISAGPQHYDQRLTHPWLANSAISMYSKEAQKDPASSTTRKLHLVDVMRGSHRFEATDPRDRVYGVIGMTSTPTSSASDESVKSLSQTGETLSIDYNKSLSEVFQDATRYCINADQSLAILSLNDGLRDSVTYGAQDINLPSWAIDWREPSDNDALKRHETRLEESTFTSRPDKQDVDSRQLLLRGIRIGQISQQRPGPPSIVLDTKLQKRSSHSAIQSITFQATNLLDASVWDHRLKPLSGLANDDICVYLAGARCPHILRPVASGKYNLLSKLSIVTSITQYLDRMADVQRDDLELFTIT